MAKSKSRFEDLPNELLTDIFKNLNARHLFQALYNLNYRLNQLLQSSFHYLQLYFYMNASHNLKTNNEVFSHYVHTLVVEPWVYFNLTHFSNVRRLKLIIPLPKILEQLKPDVMPHLEHLSISFIYMHELELLRERIFSNCFLNLKSCELFEDKTLIRIPKSTQSPSIKIFKTGFIDSETYKTILVAFPNLKFFKFWMFSLNGLPKDVQIHRNLKRLIIEYRISTSFNYDDNILSGFLSWVPNLEVLEIHRRTYKKNLQEHFETYDWLATIINYRLSILRKFKFYFYLLNDEETIEPIDEKFFIQIQSDFKNVHNDSYNAQLKIIRESL